MSSYNMGPSPKGAGAQDLLAGLLADGDITPKGETEVELPAAEDDAKKPKGKKDKKDAIAMMKALKEQQNAKKEAVAEAQAKAAAEEALRNVDVADAGPFGQACHDDKSAKVTAHVRRHAELATRGQAKVSDGAADIPAVHIWQGAAFAEPEVEPDAKVSPPLADLSSYDYKDPSELGQFPYAQLAGGSTNLPPGVNPREREKFLSDTEFCSVFGVSSREEFYKMPKLRRDKLKQAKQLDFDRGSALR
jgi:hypothetical protein|eukprot:COSAG06_NODE_8784_length_2071_cov_25.125254_2_plen_248_part_00